jgi:hypothetical protein
VHQGTFHVVAHGVGHNRCEQVRRSAHAGVGLERSVPITPSNVLPSSGPYNLPSRLSQRSVFEQHDDHMIQGVLAGGRT